MNKMLKIGCLILIAGIYGCSNSVEKKKVATKKSNVEIKKNKTNDELVFNSLDTTALLGKIFDAPVIDSSGTAVWKPNYYERMTFPVSYDGNCHTSIDTIMYFTDRQKRHCAVVLLTTYNYHKDESDSTKIIVSDCHFCGVPIGIALLSETENHKWTLYKFEKAFTTLGYFGVYRSGRNDAGKVSLKTIGDAWTCLSLIQGVGGNMGEFSGEESLYSIEEFQLDGFPNHVLSEILSYSYHYEYNDEKTKEKTDIKMKIIQKKKTYYDIGLKTTSNGKSTSDTLEYSDEYNRYISK